MIWTVNSFLSIVGAYSPFWGSPHYLSKHWIPLEADPETAWSAGVWSGQGLGITKSRREKGRKGLREKSGCDESQLAWKLPDNCKSSCLGAPAYQLTSGCSAVLDKASEGPPSVWKRVWPFRVVLNLRWGSWTFRWKKMLVPPNICMYFRPLYCKHPIANARICIALCTFPVHSQVNV